MPENKHYRTQADAWDAHELHLNHLDWLAMIGFAIWAIGMVFGG